MDIPAVAQRHCKRLFLVPTNGFIAFFVLLFAFNLPGLECNPASAQDQPIACNAVEILREAARIADLQEDTQDFWCNHLVLRIVDLQIRSHDFEGALKTNRDCGYPYGIAQAEANAIDDAIKTSLSIEYYTQYRNDALLAITEHCLKTGKKEKALKTATQISHATRKATALLRVATEYASLGDTQTARTIAGQIQLKADPTFEFLMQDSDVVTFDFANAETWGIIYDDPGFSMSSHFQAIERAGELAAAAMVLSQGLNKQDIPNYADVFKDIEAEAVRALAQSHAGFGDAKKALAWASRIGSEKKISSEDDFDITSSVKQRILALIGVAEGLLANRDGSPQKSTR